MNWNCAQLEERLSEYLDSQLAREELAAAEAHARSCPRCVEWLDARHATLWLHQVEHLESPPGLETRILALTVAPPARVTFWESLQSAWRLALTPRFALGMSTGVLALLLALNLAGVSLRDIRAADLSPGNLYRSANRKAFQTYAWGVRYVNDLRVVYEIRSRLEEMQPEAAEPPPAPRKSAPANPDPKKKDEGNKKDPSSRGARQLWMLASQTPGAWRGLR